MVLTNNCSQILITDEQLTALRSDYGTYGPVAIDVTAKVNCCDTEFTHSTVITVDTDQWNITLNKDVIVTKVNFINLNSGATFSMNANQALAGVGSFISLTNTIAAFLTGSTVSHLASAPTVDTLYYQLTIDKPVIPFSIEFTDGGTPGEEVFTNTDTTDYIIITGEGIALTPAFFDYTSSLIKGGIYSIEVTIASESTGDSFTYNQCLFSDCDIKCLIAENVSTDNNIAMIHYSLTLGGQCEGCACADMCELYKLLLRELSSCDDSYTSTLCESCDCGD